MPDGFLFAGEYSNFSCLQFMMNPVNGPDAVNDVNAVNGADAVNDVGGCSWLFTRQATLGSRKGLA